MAMHISGWLVADSILASLFGVDKSRYDWELHQHHHEEAEVRSNALVTCCLGNVTWFCVSTHSVFAESHARERFTGASPVQRSTHLEHF